MFLKSQPETAALKNRGKIKVMITISTSREIYHNSSTVSSEITYLLEMQ